ncbi:hypothetical protein CLV84_3854 [Neolewinella xylanilytica]|uniref:GIY-YIG domain-containing protein n=1 Tax=Neolewinella xylanilytica TaxID=1514080 RepID=A0A2S6I156_9BACT|nr:GIY-YIG nuclease family protein [Neolewinella xylanilytica]PPK84692.1 hypothetical protein CLV84_3854 [Neolewinella xylanilytica]
MTPEELKKLVDTSDRIATECLEQLAKKKAPQLKDFHTLVKSSDGKLVKSFQPITLSRLKHGAFNAKNNQDRKKNNTISGIYVFGENTSEGVRPVYVGRSRDIFSRFKQHGHGGDHYQSSLAYLIAFDGMSEEDHVNLAETMKETNSRSKRASMSDERLQAAMAEVREFRVYIYPEPNDYKQYFCEVAVAGLLRAKWNKFKTH